MSQKTELSSGTHQRFDFMKTQVASSDAATYLRGQADHILTIWIKLTRRQATDVQASADSNFLLNSLPVLLQNLASALENSTWHYGAARNSDIAREHGRQRQQAKIYTIGKMIDEYAILRHVICETMHEKRTWPPQITARIHAFLDAAICTASREFSGLDKQSELLPAIKQRDDSNRVAAAAQAELRVARKQRDDVKGERDASREDVAVLLEQKQVRERVVALLSHDLRSPLSSIIINAQRLENKPDDALLAARVASRVIRAANRIDRMLQDMLDVSRLRAGWGMPITPTESDLVQIAKEAYEEYAAIQGSRVKLRVPDKACGVWDGNAVRRAIDNLVGNALKYGARGTEVVIEVTGSARSARLSVHNEGNSLTEQELADLFRPYVRTDSARSSDQQGWGLGLTLVHGVAEAHGGEVGASSHPEHGTLFWFELPKTFSAQPS